MSPFFRRIEKNLYLNQSPRKSVPFKKLKRPQTTQLTSNLKKKEYTFFVHSFLILRVRRLYETYNYLLSQFILKIGLCLIECCLYIHSVFKNII